MSIIFDFYVAGLQYHIYMNQLGLIMEDDIVDLIPDPDNEYDSNAIRVEHPGIGMVGYVPKNANQEVGKLMESRDIEARIFRCDPDKDPWKALQIAIHNPDEEEKENVDEY